MRKVLSFLRIDNKLIIQGKKAKAQSMRSQAAHTALIPSQQIEDLIPFGFCMRSLFPVSLLRIGRDNNRCWPFFCMRRRDKGYSLRIGRLHELLALFLYAELVIYAEKGKQAPHTREGITTGGAFLRIGKQQYAPKGQGIQSAHRITTSIK